MTDTYYGKEDEVTTPEVELSNLKAQSGATDAVVVWAQETLVNVYDQTLAMWNAAGDMRIEAEQRGDEAAQIKLTEIQNGLTELYTNTQQMQTNLLHSTTVTKTTLEAAAALAKQKDEIESELTTLTEAIYDLDTDHPLLSDFADTIANDSYEFAYEQAGEEALEAARSEVWEVLATQLKRMFPRSEWSAINHFMAALDGQEQLNDIQRGLLLSLIQTFTTDLADAS